VKQLIVFCEGQTEQAFCQLVLQPHLFSSGDGIIHTLAVGEKDHRHVFGLGPRYKYERVKKFISNTLKQRQGHNVYFTTMFDLYALPTDFPGRATVTKDPSDPTSYVLGLQQAFEADIAHLNFYAYLQLHEYETMLFADPAAFEVSFDNCAQAIENLRLEAGKVPGVEHLNEGRETAPSKRIIREIPEYGGRKSTAGPDVAAFIGLQRIRAACPNVERWLQRLECIPWR